MKKEVKRSDIKKLIDIESTFFDIDKEKDIAVVELQFDKASELFDVNYLSKKPVLSDDFFDWIKSAFRIIPAKYKIDLTIFLKDFEGYSEDDLSGIFRDNLALEYKSSLSEIRRKSRLAWSLVALGVMFFVAMIITNAVWSEGGLIRDIFFYISDIASTVTIWEALGILIVEGRENRAYTRGLTSRFHTISFRNAQVGEIPSTLECLEGS